MKSLLRSNLNNFSKEKKRLCHFDRVPLETLCAITRISALLELRRIEDI